MIDADAMREEWLENGENEYVYDTNAFLESIDEQPTIEAVPVENIKRIVERLETASFWTEPDDECDESWEAVWLDKAIEIVKEEGLK